MLEKIYRFAAVFILISVIAVFAFFGFFMAVILLLAVGMIRLLFYFSKEKKNGTIVANGQVVDVEYIEIEREDQLSKHEKKDHKDQK